MTFDERLDKIIDHAYNAGVSAKEAVKHQIKDAIRECEPEERTASLVIGCPYCECNFPIIEEEYNAGIAEYSKNLNLSEESKK